ncbi:MAG: S1 RNA-binding domain-containing protein [Ardenticatenaceae bacterium]|nr:S1 RNA-binding domain-containing protein [Ardenticatenaceae bacterium]
MMSEELIEQEATEETPATTDAETSTDAVVEETTAPEAPIAEAVDDVADEADAETDEADAENDGPVTGLASLKRKMKLTGTVTRLELYGAFIDVGLDTNALIHISKLGKEHVNRVSDVLSVGQEVTVWVEKVDPARKQIMVTMIEPLGVEWRDLKNGQTYTGTITRLENYGAFVNIGAEREGLVHISELSHDYVKQPSEVVNVGDEVQVQVLGFSKRKRRIDLSMKALMEKPTIEQILAPTHQPEPVSYDYPEEEEIDEDVPTAMEYALRKAFGQDMEYDGRRGKKRGGKKKKQRRERSRSQQEALLERTLYSRMD